MHLLLPRRHSRIGAGGFQIEDACFFFFSSEHFSLDVSIYIFGARRAGVDLHRVSVLISRSQSFAFEAMDSPGLLRSGLRLTLDVRAPWQKVASSGPPKGGFPSQMDGCLQFA